jgi:hypothetical protein
MPTDVAARRERQVRCKNRLMRVSGLGKSLSLSISRESRRLVCTRVLIHHNNRTTAEQWHVIAWGEATSDSESAAIPGIGNAAGENGGGATATWGCE